MAYTPTEWECGDTVTAEKLNALERGIAEMNAEYVPNEWACGDVITAERLNHMEQGIAEGCGGSSDFSIAEVTVVNNSQMEAYAVGNCPAVFEANEIGEGSPATVYYTLPTVPAEATVVFHVPLYKGTCVWGNSPFGETTTHSVSGNIDTSMGMYLITGDGTITIS